MTEEIIIDGVNVAGCEFYFEDNGVIAPDGTPERANICASPEKSCENNDSCYCNKECYYKQLKRLEVECEELKRYEYTYLDKFLDLKQALEEIREIASTIITEKETQTYWTYYKTLSDIFEKINEVLGDE